MILVLVGGGRGVLGNDAVLDEKWGRGANYLLFVKSRESTNESSGRLN